MSFSMPQPPFWMTMAVDDSGRGQRVCESKDHPLLLIRGYVLGRTLPLNPHRLGACLILAES